MTTIEVDVMVDENREAILRLPPEVVPGAHRLEIVVREAHGTTNGQASRQTGSRRVGKNSLGFTVYSSGGMTEPTTFRREEIYGDDGR